MTRAVSSWGRLSRAPHEWVALNERETAGATLAHSGRPALPFGNGRSYGDVCLNAGGVLWSTRGLDRFIEFDPASGLLECEAGVTFGELIELTLPHGWFPPVTPGTRYATLGGAVANDVHGKNHHRQGCFGDHLECLTLLRSDGTQIVCGPDQHADWFRATVGGLGLTGLIATLRLRLQKVSGAWIEAQATAFESLDGFFELSAKACTEWEYSVAWVDCQAMRRGETRGILFCGNHSPSTDPPRAARLRTLPLTPPLSLVNAFSVSALNRLYFEINRRRAGRTLQPYQAFFYPLDNLLEWNRIYGPRGFYQYQCVVPAALQRDATRELLATIAASQTGSFLAVLKTFGPRGPAGLLSFPIAGTTLALDFPNRGVATEQLFERLDAVVGAAGGRIYPAKDARMPSSVFKRGYSRWREFEAFRDPGISSEMSRRLFGA